MIRKMDKLLFGATPLTFLVFLFTRPPFTCAPSMQYPLTRTHFLTVTRPASSPSTARRPPFFHHSVLYGGPLAKKRKIEEMKKILVHCIDMGTID